MIEDLGQDADGGLGGSATDAAGGSGGPAAYADGGNGGSDRDLVNAWLAAINPVTKRLVADRTSYSSQLIPEKRR